MKRARFGNHLLRSITRRSLTVAALIAAHYTVLSPAYAQTAASQPDTALDAAATQPAPSTSPSSRYLHWRQVFFWAAVLLMIFFIAAWVIIRFSLRYRAYLLREKPPPTPSDDVWRMHRLPEDDGNADS